MRFHVTGFGAFGGVADNPTTHIMRSLPDHLAAHPLPGGVSLASTTVFETSAKGSLAALRELFRSSHHRGEGAVPRADWCSVLPAVDETCEGTAFVAPVRAGCLAPVPPLADSDQFFLHLGVNSRAQCFEIELVARNDATFRIPDEQNFQCANHPVVPHASGAPLINSRMAPVIAAVVPRLAAAGFTTRVSSDCGRFVCNWTYYLSLYASTFCSGVPCLFVHVPPFSVIPQTDQLQFVCALMSELSHALASCARLKNAPLHSTIEPPQPCVVDVCPDDGAKVFWPAARAPARLLQQDCRLAHER